MEHFSINIEEEFSMDLLFALKFYWPRLIVSLLFCANVIYEQWGKRRLLTRIFSVILSFFLSCTFISIITEVMFLYPARFTLLPTLNIDQDIGNALYSIFFVVKNFFMQIETKIIIFYYLLIYINFVSCFYFW